MRSAAGSRMRDGLTLIELAVSLFLVLLVLGVLVGLLSRVVGQAQIVSGRLEAVEARRIIRDLLDHGVRGGGVAAVPGTRMRLRTFVGHGEACGSRLFAYRGRRRPDPARDSVWVLQADGTHRVSRLRSVAGAACPDSARPGGRSGVLLADLDLDSAAGPPVLVRFFESGRYTLSDALRYGRRGSPAQPLTGAVLDPGRSGLRISARRLRVGVAGLRDSVVVTREWRIP